MISKELLSAVLYNNTIEIYSIETPYPNKRIVVVSQDREPYHDHICPTTNEWNIHDLAHRIKEWSRNNNYYLTSSLLGCEIYPVDKYNGAIYALEHEIPIGENSEGDIEAATEPEAIFQAGEYILNSINKHNKQIKYKNFIEAMQANMKEINAYIDKHNLRDKFKVSENMMNHDHEHFIIGQAMLGLKISWGKLND